MKLVATEFDSVKVFELTPHSDPRGYFLESYQKSRYQEHELPEFLQDNLSFSHQGVLRGLHYQLNPGQGKLVSVVSGEILDVVVDIRRGSKTFGEAIEIVLSEDNRRQLYIPEGFAHGFCVLSITAHVSYKCTAYYRPESEYGIAWNDPDLKINWRLAETTVSVKDGQHPNLSDVSAEQLPEFG